MSIHVVGGRKLVEAFELIGIRGHVSVEGENVAALVCRLVREHGATLVLTQTESMGSLSDELLEHLARTFGCLVVEVPAVNQPQPEAGDFRRKMQSVMGAAI